MVRLLVTLLFALGLALGPVAAVWAAPGGGTKGQTSTGWLYVAGEWRSYQLHTPGVLRAGRPLLISLHRMLSSGREQEAITGFSDLADREGFLVVYPEANTLLKTWRQETGSADVTFVRELVDQLRRQYGIDPKRVYATGYSSGGGLANRLACDAPDLVAAIAGVAGAYDDWEHCTPGRPVPVIGFHGTADTIVPYMGGTSFALPPIPTWASAWAARNGATPSSSQFFQSADVTGERWAGGAPVVLYTVRGGGHTWPGSTNDWVPLGYNTNDINATSLIWQFCKRYALK